MKHKTFLFIAGTRVLLLRVDLKQEPAAVEAFPLGTKQQPAASLWAAMMDGVGEERDTFPRRPSVSLQVKQHSIQSCFRDVTVTV